MATVDNFEMEQEMEKIRLEEEEIEKRKKRLEEMTKSLKARTGIKDGGIKAKETRLTTGDDDDMKCSSTDMEELRCIVVGKTGNGKSSVINTIAGKKMMKAFPSQMSITKFCKKADILFGSTQLLVVDTPGLYDTDLKEEETLTEVGKVMAITSPGFHAFIIVMRVGRFTLEEKHTIEKLAHKFGEELYQRAVVMFTGTDDLEAENTPFDVYIKERIHKDLRQIINKCGERTIGFNNRAIGEARRIQVEMLMGLIKDIMRSNENPYYTNETYKAVEEKIEQERQEQLQDDKTKSKKQVTNDIRRSIEEEESGFGKEFLRWFRAKSCVVS